MTLFISTCIGSKKRYMIDLFFIVFYIKLRTFSYIKLYIKFNRKRSKYYHKKKKLRIRDSLLDGRARRKKNAQKDAPWLPTSLNLHVVAGCMTTGNKIIFPPQPFGTYVTSEVHATALWHICMWHWRSMLQPYGIYVCDILAIETIKIHVFDMLLEVCKTSGTRSG